MPLEKITRTNVVDPAKRIYGAISKVSPTSVPQTLFAEVLKEGALLPLRNISMITNWAGRSMMKVLGTTLKTGLLAGSLIPLPIPGIKQTSIAEMRRSGAEIREAFRAKASGDPRSFRELIETVKSVRRSAEEKSVHTLAS